MFRNIYLRLLRCILKYIENIYMKIELKIYFFCNLLKGKCKDIFFIVLVLFDDFRGVVKNVC